MIGVVEELTQEYLRKDVPEFAIGDTVDVHVKIKEGEKERIQVFNGTVIRRKGAGIGETFTVRRIVQGEGVERIFPLHSPNVADIIVKKRGRVRRAKLYYLRDRVGKGTRVREKLWTKPKEEVSAEEQERREAAAAAATEAEAADRAKAKAEADQKAKADKKKAEIDRKKKKAAKKDKRKAAKQKKGKAADKKDD